MNSTSAPAAFYTGLVADLYEPLASEPTRADDYIPFLESAGTPALELACGSGLPMIELIERGHAVEGLDSSQDMLERCRARAAERGVDVTLHLAEMQSFELPRRYRSIFLAGASFTLLPTDACAQSALERMHAHLEPGGAVLIPLEIPEVGVLRAGLGTHREVVTPPGERLRVGGVALEVGQDGTSLRYRLRYERVRANGERETLERDWERRWWSQDRFREMLGSAGFGRVAFVAPEGGPARADASAFVALARKERPT